MQVGDKIILLVDHTHHDNLESIVIPKGSIGVIQPTVNEQTEFNHSEYICVQFGEMKTYLFDPMEDEYRLVDDNDK